LKVRLVLKLILLLVEGELDRVGDPHRDALPIFDPRAKACSFRRFQSSLIH